jgi:hypothetical protein
MSDESTALELGNGKRVQTDSNVVAGVGASGGNWSPTLETAGTRSTGAAADRSTQPRRARVLPKVVQPKAKHAARTLLANCIEHLHCAKDNRSDFFLRNNALEEVRDCLGELWSMRSGREDAFAEIINLLQSVFAQRTVEFFKDEQLDALLSAFERWYDAGVIDDDLANDISMELLSGGVDVFRELY